MMVIFYYSLNNRILSESGCPGFEDVQDNFLILIYIFRNCILSESGCPGFEDVQDNFLILIYIFRNCANLNIPQYQYQILSRYNFFWLLLNQINTDVGIEKILHLKFLSLINRKLISSHHKIIRKLV